MADITTAVILAAGEGSRLRAVAPYKPLCEVGGRSLIDHAIVGLAIAGITRVVVVIGYGADVVEAHLAAKPAVVTIETVCMPDWTEPNGVSALFGLRAAGEDALLVMCDHLVDPQLYRRVREAGAGAGHLTLGVDRRLDHPWIDFDDVTKVETHAGRITDIGKQLSQFDAFDTGVFAMDQRFTEVLASLPSPSLSSGVRVLSSARALDVSGLDWLDVDDPRAFGIAEQWQALANLQ